MRVRPIAVWVVLFSLVVFAPLGKADTIDQSFSPDPMHNMSAWINACCPWIAMTYTAGLTGNLTGVNINVSVNQSYYPMRISINTVVAGAPTFAELGATTLAVGQSAPFSFLIPFSTPIAQTAGTQYAIVVNFVGAPPQSHYGGGWSGNALDPGDPPEYTGGQMWAAYPSGDWWTYGPYYDLHFQTHVETVPEPTTLLLLGTGLTGLWLKRRAR